MRSRWNLRAADCSKSSMLSVKIIAGDTVGKGPPAICVAGAVIKGGKVLLVHRSSSRSYYPDVWDLYGGHVHEGESVEDALRREAREELGINVTAFRPIGVAHDPVEPADIHLFAISDWEGEPTNMATEEHTEIRWFLKSALPESNALDGYRAEVVQALRTVD